MGGRYQRCHIVNCTAPPTALHRLPQRLEGPCSIAGWLTRWPMLPAVRSESSAHPSTAIPHHQGTSDAPCTKRIVFRPGWAINASCQDKWRGRDTVQGDQSRWNNMDKSLDVLQGCTQRGRESTLADIVLQVPDPLCRNAQTLHRTPTPCVL